MFMKRPVRSWTKEEKEKIILDIQRLGVVAGCRKHAIHATLYYSWLEKYNAHGIDGLDGRRQKDLSAKLKQLEKENKLLKEMLAEKEMENRLKGDLLKKKFLELSKKGNS